MKSGASSIRLEKKTSSDAPGLTLHYGSIGDTDSISARPIQRGRNRTPGGRYTGEGPATFEAINHWGARNVARAAAQAGVKHLVHVGAIGSVDDARLPYLYSKWRGEQAVMESGVPYTIIRASILFGPGDEFVNSLAGLVKAFPVATVAGNGRNRFQPIAVDEAAKCVALAVQRQGPLGQTVEIGGPSTPVLQRYRQRDMPHLSSAQAQAAHSAVRYEARCQVDGKGHAQAAGNH